MKKKLRVGNLGLTIDAEQLKAIFGQFGTVIGAEISLYELSGRPRGFGFVEMSNDQEAAVCISRLNGREEQGRELLVSEASSAETQQRTRRRLR